MAHRSTLTAAPAGIAGPPAPAVAPKRRAARRPRPRSARPLDAVELLLGALGRARGGRLLDGVPPGQVYDAAVTVVLRLVAAQLAEARGLLPRGDARYDRTLAVTTLPDVLAAGTAGWRRVQALFRAIHGGHADGRLRIPAYGGALFDPAAYPFLDDGGPPPVGDDVLAGMLAALPPGAADDEVERLGNVYEGLADHTAVAAEVATAGLIGPPGNAPDVPLDELEAAAALGEDELAAWLAARTGRSQRQLRRLLAAVPGPDQGARVLDACGGDAGLAGRVARWAGLLREGPDGRPVIYAPGSLRVVRTGAKRGSGTAYTSRELADELVRHALDPLVHDPGPASGTPAAGWRLRPAAELLSLRVCDPAAGSGAILVAACRYLGDRVADAWTAEGRTGDVRRAARLAVASGCLHAVDRDPVAAELARVSLWLVAGTPGTPLTFADATIRTGDALLGITSLDQLRTLSVTPPRTRPPGVASLTGEMARVLRDTGAGTLGAVADLVAGCALAAERPGAPAADDLLLDAAVPLLAALAGDAAALGAVRARARRLLDAGRPAGAGPRVPLHWPLAFPGVARFDLMVGNPPFLGGTRISGPAGADVRGYIARHLAGRPTSRADLVSFFFLRAAALARSIGFLATNSVAQGDTRETGLDRLLAEGWTVHRAVKSTPWPGLATLEIAKVWLTAGPWTGPVTLDDRQVGAIGSSLDPVGRVLGRPLRLAANRGGAFEGSKAYGMGFTMTPAEAAGILADHPPSAAVLHPFLNGDDVVTRPDHSASRWAVDFRTRTEAEARGFPACWRHVEANVKPGRMAKDASRYPRLVGQWWQHWNPRPGLYAAIAGLDRVLVLAITSRVVQPVFVPARQVLSHALVVFPFDDDHTFGVLSSGFHWWWALTYASTLEDRVRYTVTDCFATFPRPEATEATVAVAAAGRALDRHRAALMTATGRGLTRTYNAVHDPAVTDPGVAALRELHVRLDQAVGAAYGWDDLALGHGFHPTRAGPRFTFAPAARAEVLDRLLELNHRRAAGPICG